MNKISAFLKSLLSRLDTALFRYQVKSGLILCAVEEQGLPDIDEDEDRTEEFEVNNGEEDDETQDEENNAEENEEAEVVVSIGDEQTSEEETAAQAAPQWVKDLRKQHRELQKQNKQLQEQLTAVSGTAQKPQQLGNKPTLESCEYDEQRFEKELTGWYDRKREIEAEERKQQEQQEQANREWQAQLDGYGEKKKALKVKDFDDAEDVVKDLLSTTQQGIIVRGCKDPALVVYALGKNPKKLKEISEIKDPVKYAFAIAELEGKLKVSNKRTAPPPEKAVRGNGSVSGTVDSTLERLRNEAAKSGDYSKVMAYKRQLANKGK